MVPRIQSLPLVWPPIYCTFCFQSNPLKYDFYVNTPIQNGADILTCYLSPHKMVCPMYLVAQSCLTLCDTKDYSPPGSSVQGDSPGKNTGGGCHFLLQPVPLQQLMNSPLQCAWTNEPPGYCFAIVHDWIFCLTCSPPPKPSPSIRSISTAAFFYEVFSFFLIFLLPFWDLELCYVKVKKCF